MPACCTSCESMGWKLLQQLWPRPHGLTYDLWPWPSRLLTLTLTLTFDLDLCDLDLEPRPEATIHTCPSACISLWIHSRKNRSRSHFMHYQHQVAFFISFYYYYYNYIFDYLSCRHTAYPEPILNRCDSFRSEPILNKFWTIIIGFSIRSYWYVPIHSDIRSTELILNQKFMQGWECLQCVFSRCTAVDVNMIGEW